MSSDQSQFAKSSKPGSSSSKQPDELASSPEQRAAKTAMDESSDSTLAMTSFPPSPEPVPPQPSQPAEVAADSSPASSAGVARQHPIPPASEPMQYRAIGLMRGRYVPSEEQFTRGEILADDGTVLKAVLLGRVMSLVKKHLDLEQPHLWVVYPRTREKEQELHIQIVGVWEPEKLNRTAEEEAAVASTAPEADLELPDNYFSIRGEVIFYAPDDQRILVRIQQAPKKSGDDPKAFKLLLTGELEGKGVGYFWDLNVQRQDNQLVVQDGSLIGLVPPKKRQGRSAFKPSRGGGGRKPWRNGTGAGGAPPRREGPRPMPGSAGPTTPREPIQKPMKRQKPEQP